MLRIAPNPRRLLACALLGAAGASLGGCQTWNAWLDFLKWKEPAKNAPLSPEPVAKVLPQAPLGNAAAANPALLPRVTVYMIILPLGTFSKNDQIWSQLNEDALDSKTAVLMAQNGLR